MLAALVLTALAAQTPAPAESPLKEIIRVTSRPLCTAIRDRIGPSVAALLENDDAIANGTHYVFEMGRDEGHPWMQMDKLHLENDISKIVRNLEAIDRLLRTESSDAAADGSDHATVDDLKSKLRKVADSQRSELNVLDGTLESEEMAELMNSDLPTSLTTSGFALGKLPGDEISSDTAAYTSSLPTPGPSAAPLLGSTTQALMASAATKGASALPESRGPDSRNTYSKLGVAAIGGIQSTQSIERAFTQDLLPAAAQCQRLASPPPK
jgi:hypothetical protein